MEWLWGYGGGHTLFDPYSLQHVVWFFAITVALGALRLKRLWSIVISIAVLWEIAEWWIVDNLPGFPFVGREDMINKMIGDPISDAVGFFLGLAAMRAVRAVINHRSDPFLALLEQAKAFATKVHKKKKYGKFPYTYHLFGTWDVLEKFGFSKDDPDPDKRRRNQRLILAAVLHDTLEDTNLTYGELANLFGTEVADLVFAVTNEPGENRRERFLKTYPKIRANPDAVALKLADRIANVIHALQINSDILDMYRQEWSEFEKALRRPGEHEEMWKHLESILEK